ncbi:hypothetical protein DPMN_080951 [Dreissena polymorpha]|uniref:Uncharacterized protein n=1 Tax=Dreissena polymorpha TaxID=45954 RepID=A0A9D4BHA5_DREPO|nr:hypothetical protein DPMN_080951 [Dreissena polymorpha]
MEYIHGRKAENIRSKQLSDIAEEARKRRDERIAQKRADLIKSYADDEAKK